MNLDEQSPESIRDFIYFEADLIDRKMFDDWYELFLNDAIYWMPLKRQQTEAEIHNSLFFEDKLLLKVRIERLKHPRVYSQQTPSYCQHVLQRPQILGAHDQTSFETKTAFIYVESHAEEQLVLAGTLHHELRATDAGLRIFRKRIELLNRDSALPSIQLFL